MFLSFVLVFTVIVSFHSILSNGDGYDIHASVMTDENALILLKRQIEISLDKNLPRYLDEIRQTNPQIGADFKDMSFAVVGSLATVDAAITFVENIYGLNAIRKDRAAGFPGMPVTGNEKLHNALPALNAIRNSLWLLKEKLRNGVIASDASLKEKLQEVQVWLSSQTGGHLGQLAGVAFDKSGLTKKLKLKWGATSTKMKAFSAVKSNGLDFAINAFNTAMNSIALHDEVSPTNVLALTSSVTAMAGDIAMTVTQIISKGAVVAGPVGAGIAATLYIASYATGVAAGLVSKENLEAKDYVIIFLSPLVLDPTFPAVVETIDLYIKGYKIEALYTFLTKTFAGQLSGLFIFIRSEWNDSNEFMVYRAILNLLKYTAYYKRRDDFKKKVAELAAPLIKKLKPKQVLYPYPSIDHGGRYIVDGWDSNEKVMEQFSVDNLSSLYLFIAATYQKEFSTPVGCPDEIASLKLTHCPMVVERLTFCPQLVQHNNNKLLFLGNDKVDDKVMLDDNSEAYGMGGNDYFVLQAAKVHHGVTINGGSGNDCIDIFNSFFGSSSVISGGGPENDTILAGPGNDTIVVNNDTVVVINGNNTILVEGEGNDTIRLGNGADLVHVEKTGGRIEIDLHTTSKEPPNLPKRIVYEGKGIRTIKNKELIDDIKLGWSHFDVLAMNDYFSSPPNLIDKNAIVLLEKETVIREYMEEVRHLGILQFYDMPTNFQQIHFQSIERFEFSKHTSNVFLLKKRGIQNFCELHGGPFNDFVINLSKKPLNAQMGTGNNRILSGEGNDIYSMTIKNCPNSIVWDKGGDNIFLVLLPKGTSLNDALISRYREGPGYTVRVGSDQIKFIFLEYKEKISDTEFRIPGNMVQIIVKETTGKQIIFKKIPAPHGRHGYFSEEHSVGSYYYDKFQHCRGDSDVMNIVEDIFPPYGKKLPPMMCHPFPNKGK